MICAKSVGESTTREPPHEVSAQCSSCGLSELCPVQLQQDPDGSWLQVGKRRWFRRAAPDPTKVMVQIDACPACFGAWFDAGELDVLAGPLQGVEQVIDPDPKPSRRPCPHGHGSMQEHVLPGVIRTPLDRCPHCGGIWLDGNERRKLAKATTTEGQGTRTQRFLERGAIWAVQVLTRLPIEVENPARSTPWIIYTVIAVLLAFYGGQALEQIDTYHYGLVPGRLRAKGDWDTLVSYMFLHGSWAHLFGNLYFLYTFGDNVEYLFGRIRFAIFFVVSGVIAGLIHHFVTLKTATPIVGASGAIAGVLAAYLWAFPKQRLHWVLLWFPIKIPVWVFLGVWIVFHIVMGFFGTGHGAEEVAWFAHLGGFACGFAVAPLMLALRRRAVARKVKVPAMALRAA
jgi:membrane associated rhomboid family serine protease/Zn-finger nucleic acid-binding protein